ncbi:RNA-binding domain-containing protein [Meira miltonrushii]|uniref:RNA-binding domain-containing protein n=1 Tax=Meira miltonrushii TaxID=1280837 RepID=A0A316V6G9_9BASI|nr:RNA-binding domain-containing protein [Meira miltonrushii]PWN33189.1 RNA-binding domain-containing protein [Meira miltonrushii]
MADVEKHGQPSEAQLGEEMMDAEDDQGENIPVDASETIYVKNLNESVQIETLKQTLRNLFGIYGKIVDIIAHKNVRMRGQAFISFESKAPAVKAVKEVRGFPLYGKPIQLAFARTTSDEIVKKNLVAQLGGDENGIKSALEAHKQQRLEHKKRQRTQWRRRQLALRAGENEGQNANIGGVPGMDGSAAAAGKRQEAQLPDEYLPPNKILFIHNVPDSVDKDALDALFRSHDGIIDVRHIPGRNVAFVEFGNAMQSSAARDALNEHQFTPQSEKLRITFAK